MINKKITVFIFWLTLITALVFGVNKLILKYIDFKPDQNITYSYIFLYLLTLAIYFVMIIILKRSRTFMGYAFIGISFLKMLASIVFLLPEIINKDEKTIPFVINFFILYFIFLSIEVIFLYSYINKKIK